MKEEEYDWEAAVVECRVCSHRHVSVHPVVAPRENLECSRCHAMSCEVVEAIE